MAVRQLSNEDVITLIVSLENLWSCALTFQNRILNHMAVYNIQRKRLLHFILTEQTKQSRRKKPVIPKPREYWVRPGRTNSWLAHS